MAPPDTDKQPAASTGTAEKVQPWKAFIKEPKIQPFPTDNGMANTVIRLRTEKDEHGLGGWI